MAEQNESTTPKKEPKKAKVGFFRRVRGGMEALSGWNSIKEGSSNIKQGVKVILQVQKPTHKETFAEAMVRLNLTEADIKERESNFLRLSLIITVFAILCLLYTLYLLWQAAFLSALLALVVTLLCIATAARYHFWYFQTKNRKLGCTIHEWLNARVDGGKE